MLIRLIFLFFMCAATFGADVQEPDSSEKELLKLLPKEDEKKQKKFEFDEQELQSEWGEKNPCGADAPLSLRDALRYTLQYQQRVKINIQDVKRQSGVVQELAGPFDPVADLSYELTQTDNAQDIDFTTRKHGDLRVGQFGEKKKFRIGTEVSVNTEIQQVKDPSQFTPEYNLSNITFNITQPLLRGFLCGLEASEEKASQFNLRATYYDALHNISEEVLTTVIRYWDVVQAQKILEIRKESVERFELLVKKTKRLVEENQIAQSEINQPLANLASERVNYTIALQNLYTTMQFLKLATGLVQTQCISKDLFKAVDGFPHISEEEEVCALMDRFVAFGVQYRLDLRAFFFKELEFRTLLSGAKNEILPRLDVFGEYNVNNIKRHERSRSFFSSYDYRIPERNYTAGVVVSTPFCNDRAKGRYRRILADLRKTTYEAIDLKQNIMTEVMDIWMNHFRIIKEIKDAKKAIQYFTQLVIDENKRLDAGIGSLFNLIDFQNRLTDSQERLINRERDYAENLARLHFQTGLLLYPDSTLCCFGVQDMTTLPEPASYD